MQTIINQRPDKMKTRNLIIGILLLVVLDQLIKIIINAYYFDNHFEIVPSLLEFKPTFNTRHSYVNDLLYTHLNIDIGFWAHIILYLLIGLFMPVFYVWLRDHFDRNGNLLGISFIFLFAALVCTSLGSLIWKNGTLDYIYLKPLFVFDLKDVYTDIAIGFFLVYALKNKKQLNSAKFKLKDLVSYFMKQLTTNKQNNENRETERLDK